MPVSKAGDPRGPKKGVKKGIDLFLLDADDSLHSLLNFCFGYQEVANGYPYNHT
jgi:hypothetical protein